MVNKPTSSPTSDPASGAPQSLTIEELAELTGLTRRTIRFYVLSGVVTGAQGQGPSARYPASHVPRLRLVRRWQDDGLQLAVIAQRLGAMSDSDAAQVASQSSASQGSPTQGSPRQGSLSTSPTEVAHPASEPSWPDVTRAEPSPSDSGAFVRSPWERFELEPGVELHVRRPLTTAANRRVQRLLEVAASLKHDRTRTDSTHEGGRHG